MSNLEIWKDLMLPNPCLQHHTGNVAGHVADALDIFTQAWTVSKTFGEGDFHQDLMESVDWVLDDEDYGLEVVDPTEWRREPGDLSESFTLEVLKRCYTHGLGPGEDGEDARKVAQI